MRRSPEKTFANPTLAAALPLVALTTIAHAAPLTGSGANLPFPSPNPGTITDPVSVDVEYATRTSVTGGFTGGWSAAVRPDWYGTYTATGPEPNSLNSGDTQFDFTGMANGSLPVGTYIYFGDVDDGAGVDETFTLQAFADAAGTSPLSAWLDETVGVRKLSNGNDPPAADLAAWAYDPSTGVYTVDGRNVAGNPNIAFMLQNNQSIVRLDVTKASLPYQLNLAAPVVPEPSTACCLLLSLCMVGTTGARSRHG